MVFPSSNRFPVNNDYHRIWTIMRSKIRRIRSITHEAFSFFRGYREFRSTSETPKESYHSLRKLYCLTNGRFNDAVSWVLSFCHTVNDVHPGESILGELSDNAVARIVEDIETNGFHVFDCKLSPRTIRALRAFAETIPCRAVLTSREHKLGEYVDVVTPYPQHPVQSPRYDIAQHHILGNVTVQGLLMDSGFYRVAHWFLRCDPILDV